MRQYLFNRVCLYNNQFIFYYLFTNENMRYYSAKICYEILMREKKHILY
jgi:hypothetical protein